MVGPRFLPAGEAALTVEYGATADAVFHDSVLALDAALATAPIEGIIETVPTYRSLTVHFDPGILGTDELVERLRHFDLAAVRRGAPRHWRIPACYDPPYSEDLDEVAQRLDLTPDHVAELHVAPSYKVVMYGFAPGFVFLAGLPDALRIPRRVTPRSPAPQGALTVANGQALIASVAMPTGWYMLGRTPARTFDVAREPVLPIAVGDKVTFERIDAARFAVLEREVAAGHDPLARAD